MLDKIRKRNGRVVPFEPQKIHNVLARTMESFPDCSPQDAARVSQQVIDVLKITCKSGRTPEVEEVQDLIEKSLMDLGFSDVAREFIVYRSKHAEMREAQQLISSAVKLIDDYIEDNDWRIKENSNMTYSLQGMNNHISSVVVSNYWLDKIYGKEMRKAHNGGDLHIHDLGTLGAYCCGWELRDLLTEGFTGVANKLESSPPCHFGTALGQVTNFFYTLQGEAAGAQAFSNFDTLLAPYVYYDKLTKQQVYQELQEFLFNMNVPTRVGFQTPFTNISFDLTPPSYLKDEYVTIGTEVKDKTYKEFQQQMDWINDAFCQLMSKGDYKGRIFTFPIPTYNITKDFDFDNSKLDSLWQMTAKYGIPYFANFVNSDMNPDDARSMCCRLRLDTREINRRGGGLFGANPLTGSIGVVTINLPRIGYTSRTEEEYFGRLGHLMDLARDVLEIKRKFVESLIRGGLFPYSKFYLRKIKALTGNYWTNHFATIGLVGMNESCLNFLGKTLLDDEAKAFAAKVLDFMKDRLGEYKQQTGNLYNLEATPAESTSYRLAKLDRAKYRRIQTAGAEFPYYTNSTHFPVGEQLDLFEALSKQDELQCKYTGGTVFHAFLGEQIKDIEVVKKLVKTITTKFALPYFTLTPTFSVCSVHGYLSGEQFKCPHCGTETEVYSRVVGYYRPVKQWNEGKQEEYADRKTYNY